MKRPVTMKAHAPTVLILLAALVCHSLNLDGAGLALFFAGAVHEVWLWLRTVQRPTRAHGRATQMLRNDR